MALYTGRDPSEYSRLPCSGWILWAVSLTSQFSHSMRRFHLKLSKTAADQLVTGVSEAAGLLKEMLEGHPGASS